MVWHYSQTLMNAWRIPMDASRYAQTLLEVIRVLALLAIACQVIIVTAMVSKEYEEIERLVSVLMHVQ